MKNLQVRFKTGYTPEEDATKTIIQIEDELKELLKECSIEGTTESEYGLRYRVKTPIISNLIGDKWQILFLKELLDTNKTSITNPSIESSNNTINDIKRLIARIVRNCYDLRDREVILTLNIAEAQDE